MVLLNLSYKSLKSCLDELAASNLITTDVEAKRTTVGTTQEGVKVVSLYRSAISGLRKARIEQYSGKTSSRSSG